MYPVKTALIVSSDSGLLLVACATSCIGLTCDCLAVSIKYRRFLQYFFRGRLLVAMALFPWCAVYPFAKSDACDSFNGDLDDE